MLGGRGVPAWACSRATVFEWGYSIVGTWTSLPPRRRQWVLTQTAAAATTTAAATQLGTTSAASARTTRTCSGYAASCCLSMHQATLRPSRPLSLCGLEKWQGLPPCACVCGDSVALNSSRQARGAVDASSRVSSSASRRGLASTGVAGTCFPLFPCPANKPLLNREPLNFFLNVHDAFNAHRSTPPRGHAPLGCSALSAREQQRGAGPFARRQRAHAAGQMPLGVGHLDDLARQSRRFEQACRSTQRAAAPQVRVCTRTRAVRLPATRSAQHSTAGARA